MPVERAPVRFGVVGCGVIAYWTHLRVIRGVRSAALVAAADPDPDARARARRLTGLPVCADAAEVIARGDVDAVVVAAPPAAHAELAVAAARGGKHVYLEKPIATTASDGRRVVAAVDEARVVAAIGFNRRRHPAFERARDVVRAGRLGAVRAVHSSFCEPTAAGEMPEWKRRRATGGGVLLDLASHHIDLVRFLLDDEVADVECRLTSEASEHDGAWLRLALRGGAEACSFFSFRAARSDAFELIGERATLRIDRHRTSPALRVSRRLGYGVRRAPLWPSPASIAWRAARLLRPSYESSYARALAAFADEIRGGPPQGLATAADGLRALEVVLAAEESDRTGQAIALEPA
ncbi:MAG TPA: Gfo/Idh/MocA family oxidoreductase [Candidatus Binatia bacterium]|nr:Gfo/Idh/MocA family oxidoreductase [Candidatus Binatia bacterium]